ncbi:MAG: hypothetical protein H6R37_662 [Deltaproteobacteria bacterium]|jgi:hypothetical protein|nr:hypothetical protein [Deltaproteobacteria bacterium]
MGIIEPTLLSNCGDLFKESFISRTTEIIRGSTRIPDTGGFQNPPDDFKNK